MEHSLNVVTFVTIKTECYMAEKVKYGSIRLPEPVVDDLKDVRLAFESCYLRRFTNEDLMHKLIACIEDAEPAVWETYCKIVVKRDEEAAKEH